MWLHLTDVGGVWVNASGSINEHEIKLGEELVVDNLHLVAWTIH